MPNGSSSRKQNKSSCSTKDSGSSQRNIETVRSNKTGKDALLNGKSPNPEETNKSLRSATSLATKQEKLRKSKRIKRGISGPENATGSSANEPTSDSSRELSNINKKLDSDCSDSRSAMTETENTFGRTSGKRRKIQNTDVLILHRSEERLSNQSQGSNLCSTADETDTVDEGDRRNLRSRSASVANKMKKQMPTHSMKLRNHLKGSNVMKNRIDENYSGRTKTKLSVTADERGVELNSEQEDKGELEKAVSKSKKRRARQHSNIQEISGFKEKEKEKKLQRNTKSSKSMARKHVQRQTRRTKYVESSDFEDPSGISDTQPTLSYGAEKKNQPEQETRDNEVKENESGQPRNTKSSKSMTKKHVPRKTRHSKHVEPSDFDDLDGILDSQSTSSYAEKKKEAEQESSGDEEKERERGQPRNTKSTKSMTRKQVPRQTRHTKHVKSSDFEDPSGISDIQPTSSYGAEKKKEPEQESSDDKEKKNEIGQPRNTKSSQSMTRKQVPRQTRHTKHVESSDFEDPGGISDIQPTSSYGSEKKKEPEQESSGNEDKEKEKGLPRNTKSSKSLATKHAPRRQTRTAKHVELSEVDDSVGISNNQDTFLGTKKNKEAEQESNEDEKKEKRRGKPKHTRSSKSLATKQVLIQQTRSAKHVGSSEFENPGAISDNQPIFVGNIHFSYTNEELNFDTVNSALSVLATERVLRKRKGPGGNDDNTDTFHECEKTIAPSYAKRTKKIKKGYFKSRMLRGLSKRYIERWISYKRKIRTNRQVSSTEVVNLQTREEQSEMENQGGEWHRYEIERLYKGVMKTHPSGPYFWLKVSQLVKTKSAQQCQDFYQEMYERIQQNTKKHSTAAKKGALESVTGGVRTMKRKREISAVLENKDKGYEADISDSTPFKKRLTRFKVVNTSPKKSAVVKLPANMFDVNEVSNTDSEEEKDYY